jgi:hypothetical protein
MSSAPCIDLCGSDEDEESSKQKIMSMARAANLQTGRGVNASIPPQSTRASTAMLTGTKRQRESPEPSSSSLPRISNGLNDIRREIEKLESRPKVSLAAKIAALESSGHPVHGDQVAETTAAPRQPPSVKYVLCIMSSSDEEDDEEGKGAKAGRQKQRQKKVHEEAASTKSSSGLSLIDNVLGVGSNLPLTEPRRQPRSAATEVGGPWGVGEKDSRDVLVLDSQTSGPMAKGSSPIQVKEETGPNNLLAQLAVEREERRRRNQQQGGGPSSPMISQQPGRSQPKGHMRSVSSPAPLPSSSMRQATILTWNVWFREDLALEERMILGISAKVVEYGYPDFILVQECTPDILEIWMQKAPWWEKYDGHRQK